MSNKVDTGGKRLNLFPAKKQKKKLSVDDKAFNTMEAVADKTNVDIFAEGKKSSTKGIHTALLAAGMTPAYGNVADVADATLYALEGEFGEAAWSMAAAIPIVGQMVAGRRAAKIAKEAGEEMVTLYRGVDKWYPKRKTRMVDAGTWQSYEEIVPTYNTMVDRKTGNFIGKGGGIWTSADKNYAKTFTSEHFGKHSGRWAQKQGTKYEHRHSRLLEFEVPKSYIKKFGHIKEEGPGGTLLAKEVQEYTQKHYGNLFFDDGIPKEFLKKVHK